MVKPMRKSGCHGFNHNSGRQVRVPFPIGGTTVQALTATIASASCRADRNRVQQACVAQKPATRCRVQRRRCCAGGPKGMSAELPETIALEALQNPFWSGLATVVANDPLEPAAGCTYPGPPGSSSH